MRALILMICFVSVLSNVYSDDINRLGFQIRKVNDGFYFLYIDSSSIKKNITKGAILEFTDHVMLIDLPISYGGAGTNKLIDYVEKGNTAIQYINKYFPTKPLKYFLASHWHPHCISSINPFLKNNIQVVLSQKNYDKIKEMIDSNEVQSITENIKIINQDIFNLQDDFNSITIYLVEKKDYEYLPTEEFLYFYMPRYKYFHTSCMYQRYKGSNIMNREVVSPRTEDLATFLNKIKLTPDFFICDDTFFDENNGLISTDTFKLIIDRGIKFSEMKSLILENAKQTNYNLDSAINNFMINKLPISLLNNLVSRNLKDKNYNTALFFARLQCILAPSNLNSWDTYGEVYYFMGNKEMAKKYENECKKIDKNFIGGEEIWKTEYKEYNK